MEALTLFYNVHKNHDRYELSISLTMSKFLVSKEAVVLRG